MPGVSGGAVVRARGSVEGKSLGQYQAVFLQVADEHRSVNAFQLHELLEACLPNGQCSYTTLLSYPNAHIQRG